MRKIRGGRFMLSKVEGFVVLWSEGYLGDTSGVGVASSEVVRSKSLTAGELKE
jgi:hypothetical protein